MGVEALCLNWVPYIHAIIYLTTAKPSMVCQHILSLGPALFPPLHHAARWGHDLSSCPKLSIVLAGVQVALDLIMWKSNSAPASTGWSAA